MISGAPKLSKRWKTSAPACSTASCLAAAKGWAAAARQANAVLQQLRPPTAWQSELEPPPAPAEELLEKLQGMIDREESVEVLYKAAGRSTADYRHLSPLLVEQRGERFYLIAYCHLRRANRTFRPNRLELIESHPPS